MPRPSFDDFASGQEQICILGLGYVGLPLAAAFAKKFRVVGFDINERRVQELKTGHDRTCELTSEQLSAVRAPPSATGPGLTFSTDAKVLGECRLIIVTVPTPIDDHKNPDLTPLIKSSTSIGQRITKNTTVVYESTVYPGCTEEDCLPIIERESGLKWKTDFYAGYSP